METIIWIGIAFCISQSAMFSGSNLAFFSISKLRLEVETAKKNRNAEKILSLRQDANFLLTTILWGNVGINVLLTLLSNSVMAGLLAFLFSTVVITFIGEIIPQAYFSRHAMKTAALLVPVLQIYQRLLYPVAKPSAWVLDRWLGPEAIQFFQEKDLQAVIKMHLEDSDTDIDRVEGVGAINFLALDDIAIENEGEPLDPESVISLDFVAGRPEFPAISGSPSDEFLKQLQRSGRKWVIVVDPDGHPGMVIDSDSFLREALFGAGPFNPYRHCHRPIVVSDAGTRLGETILKLKVVPTRSGDDVVDEDIILLWGTTRRVITGADILGRLLRGIVQQETVHFNKRLTTPA